MDTSVLGRLAPELTSGTGLSDAEGLVRWGQRLSPPECLREAPGRETFVVPGHADWIVKRRRGAERGFERWHERWRQRFRGPSGQDLPGHGEGATTSLRLMGPVSREAAALKALAGLGLAVPRVLGWAESEDAGVLVLQRVPFRVRLDEALVSAGSADERAGVQVDVRQLASDLLALVVPMHRAGWYHRDLYLHHVVLSEAGSLVLLDLGRARRDAKPRLRWFVKDLAALYSTLPAAVERTEALRFLRAWSLAVRGRLPERRFVRAILRRATTMRTRRPRHVQPGGRWGRVGRTDREERDSKSGHGPREDPCSSATC